MLKHVMVKCKHQIVKFLARRTNSETEPPARKKKPPPDIDSLITAVRGQQVILDADLAGIYQVPTKALNQAVKRNREKFPEDFLFELTRDEAEETRRLRSQSVTLK